jgi:hypothetical protein
MTKDEALRLALDAFGEIDWSNNSQWQSDRAKVAIASLKEALEQREQDGKCKYCTNGCPACDARKLPEQDWIERERAVGYREGHRAALAQRTWIGLTDEELTEAMKYWSDDSNSSYGGAYAAEGEYFDVEESWRYIEAKLKEKNNG